MSTLISTDDLKTELEIEDNEHDPLLQRIANAVEDLLDELTNRTFATGTRTEYYSTDDYVDTIFLKNRPVSSITTVHDDPDWDYGDGELVSSSNYTFDADEGVLYYDGYFFRGRRNVKVVYVAGYSASTFPSSMKEILVRQAAVWYKQAISQDWATQMRVNPAGAGSVMIGTKLSKNLLPEFEALVEREKN